MDRFEAKMLDAWLRYLLFDAGLSVILPLLLLLGINSVYGRSLDIATYLGDGQLCFYATTVSVVAIREITSPNVPPDAMRFWGVTALATLGLVGTALWGSVVTAGVIGLYGHEKVRVQRRVTWASVALSTAAVILAGILRQRSGVL